MNYQTLILALILGLISTTISANQVTVCNDCTFTQAKNASIKVGYSYEDVHNLDFMDGNVQSFTVEHEGRMSFAYPAVPPQAYIDATYEFSLVINNVVSNGGTFNKYTNKLTQTVRIPSSIASTSGDLYEYIVSQAVSNHLRFVLINSFWSKFQKSWEKVVENIIFEVEVVFDDNSSAKYLLGPIFFSDHPFILQRDSIVDSNGNPVSASGGQSSQELKTINYSSPYSSGLYGSVYRKCSNYTITSSDGSSWSDKVCWYTQYP